MNCPNCQNLIQEGELFCGKCGNRSAPQTSQLNTQAYQTIQSQTVDQKGKAVASMVLGCIGMIAWFLPIIGLPIQIVGIVLGVKGKKSSKSGIAVAGLVLSIIGLVLTIANASIGAYQGVLEYNATQERLN